MRVLILLLLLTAAGVAQPTTKPYAWRERAAPMRKLLTAAIAHRDAHEGHYPAALAELDVGQLDPVWLGKLVYRPDAAANLEPRAAGSAVLFHEPLASPDAGAWVAFADGRLEFVRDAAALQARLDQAALVASIHPAATQPASAPTTQPGDQITLRVSTPDGQPAAGVFVSGFPFWSEGPFGPPSLLSFAPRPAVYTDSQGVATLPASELFRIGGPPVALYALDRENRLAAITPLGASAFNREHHARLAPGIAVGGSIDSVALENAGRDIGNVTVTAVLAGPTGGSLLMYQSIGRRFDLLLPPGDYHLAMQGENTESLVTTFRLRPGTPGLELDVDLPPARIMLLMGQPAPELERVAAWRGQPLKLADLRGKHVALCFWYSEGGWLTRRVPALMDLRQELDGRLEVIFVHAPLAGGFVDLEPRLASLREERWEGREFEMPLALDADAGKIVSSGRRRVGVGRTAEAYGVTPGQVVLINPDGRVHDRTTIWDAEGAIRGWLNAAATQPAR